ncbi:elongation factor 1-gamma (EF-1-gamma), putative [Trypanosoma cruzi]|uniref:Elongation factor 1-gamma (EF-1-gamma), putative n=1 Tax=Trypanosoma cruzi (strain CL Brener) TaxID=353153 RepID=Q4DMZ6_TRYCC|nr:elongation factor 1-gamma (EF-1-gamma), putative [Trypanosoma cruzi]EAN93902.1 elongation factor 1-gamma (EF-1-gamma), putative [Trypanosoma cruzi]|eukprot:XP_815753.1 elongation factor 1-gamma (EF-1-gamma) [Trypanosoma cruzi strain CL Brener]
MQCMTANLIGMCLQRMEHVRQYLLGVALMIVEERRHDVVALCVLRGRGLPAIVWDVEYTELFDWGGGGGRCGAAGVHDGLPLLGGARVEVSVACL